MPACQARVWMLQQVVMVCACVCLSTDSELPSESDEPGRSATGKGHAGSTTKAPRMRPQPVFARAPGCCSLKRACDGLEAAAPQHVDQPRVIAVCRKGNKNAPHKWCMHARGRPARLPPRPMEESKHDIIAQYGV